MVTVRTREDDERRFEDAGLRGAALDLALDATAPARHASRVQAAMEAALARADEIPHGDFEERVWATARLLYAAIFCFLDWAGWGGPKGIGGHATGRVPCFRRLGKGRKQARDGSAWSAAIAEAARELIRATGHSSQDRPDLYVAPAGDAPELCIAVPGGASTCLGLAHLGEEELWALGSIAANATLCALGERPVRSFGDDRGFDPELRPQEGGSPGDWSVLYNAVQGRLNALAEEAAKNALAEDVVQ